jgi:hypothetical protein
MERRLLRRRGTCVAVVLGLLLSWTAAPPPLAAGEIHSLTGAAICYPDTDKDGLCDAFEEALVKRFFPNLWVTYSIDRTAFYGCITSDPYARIPYMVERVWYDGGSVQNLACLYPNASDCLLLKIGLAYDEDFGDDVWGGGHVGDSEFYYALLSRVGIDRAIVKKNAAGNTCTPTVANNDATCWWLMVDWTSAHSGEPTDESYHTVHSPFVDTIGDSDAAVVYAAEGKHANYHLDGECDAGNIGSIDNCAPKYNIRDTCFFKFQNIGNSVILGGNGQGDGYPREIRYPRSSSLRYDMWRFDEFAGSSAYRPKFDVSGAHLWNMWYACVTAGSASAKAVYCNRFDVSCQSDDSCTCNDSCSPNRNYLACGNGVCSQGLETCSSCPADCGVCPAVCGNGLCQSGETCSSCPADCGQCPTGPVCGDGLCQSGESCETGGGAGECQQDCGCCSGWKPICFAAGTPVTMADGSTKAIERIAEGDLVLAYEETSGRVIAAPVTRTYVHTDVHEGLLAVNGSLFATADHPFYVAGRSGPVRAADLRVGDELLVLDRIPGTAERGLGTTTVDSLKPLPAAGTVYNIEVAGPHNYFAGGVLVHNKTSGAGCEPDGGPLP